MQNKKKTRLNSQLSRNFYQNILSYQKQPATGLPRRLRQNWCGYQWATVRLLGFVALMSEKGVELYKSQIREVRML